MHSLLKLGLFIIPIVLLLSSTKIKGVNLIQSPQPTEVPSPTISPTATETPTPTSTPIPTLTLTPTSTPKPSPTPTPTITPIPVTNEQLDSWFTTYSNQFSVDRERLWSIALCESKLNPNAISGDYAGLFQFASKTWQTTRKLMNLDPNPQLRFNPEESIKTAAFKISTSGLSPWKNCVK